MLPNNYRTDMSEDTPAMDVSLVHHAGWAVLLGYDLRGGGRLGDGQHLVDGLHLR